MNKKQSFSKKDEEVRGVRLKVIKVFTIQNDAISNNGYALHDNVNPFN